MVRGLHAAFRNPTDRTRIESVGNGNPAVLVDPSEKQSWFCATPATNPDFDCLCDWRRKKHPPLLVALAYQGEGTVVEIELVDADAGNFSAAKSAAEHE